MTTPGPTLVLGTALGYWVLPAILHQYNFKPAIQTFMEVAYPLR